jgi:hypothetical protein
MYYLNRKRSNYEMNISWDIKQIMQHVLKMHSISLLPEYIKLILRGAFLHAFPNTNVGHLKVNLFSRDVISYPTNCCRLSMYLPFHFLLQFSLFFNQFSIPRLILYVQQTLLCSYVGQTYTVLSGTNCIHRQHLKLSYDGG